MSAILTSNTCCCSEGTATHTPLEVTNRPGLPAIACRIGTYAQFKEAMISRLSSSAVDALRYLTTRDGDDFSIALLDAWAVVADVLTFYQERMANESYLRTAIERLSVVELARLIGYEPSPGVAASTHLVFTAEETPGSSGQMTIDKGTKVQSIPGPGEEAQLFETVEKIEARAEWSELKPRKTEPKVPVFGTEVVYLKGTSTNLKQGDGLLFVGARREKDPGNENWDFRRVKTITTNSKENYTVITLDRPLGSRLPYMEPAKTPKVYAMRQRAALFGHNAPDWRSMPDTVKKAYGSLTASEWPGFTVTSISSYPYVPLSIEENGLCAEYYDNPYFTELKFTRIDKEVDFNWGFGSPDSLIGSETFSVRWSGWVQPKTSGTYTFYTLSDDGVRLWVNGQLIINNWTEHAETEDRGAIVLTAGEKVSLRLDYFEKQGVAKIRLYWSGPGQAKAIVPQSQLYPNYVVHLDAAYPQILPKSWLVLSIPEYQELYRVEAATEDSRNNFAIAAKTTRVSLWGEHLRFFDKRVRETMVFAQSELLDLAETPITSAISGDSITLDQKVDGLKQGQTFIVSGTPIYFPLIQIPIFSTFAVAEVKPVTESKATNRVLPITYAKGVERDVTLVEHEETMKAEIAEYMKLVIDEISAVTPSSVAAVQPAGQDTDTSAEPTCEVVTLLKAEPDGNLTKLVFTTSLKSLYRRDSVTIYGNVARATHGETVKEVLGSGNASQPFQHFTLKQSPLTHVSAATPSGAESTLEVRVNDLLWHEVGTLYGRGPHERIYVCRSDDQGKTMVQFGNGRSGARLATGLENVRATYRKGIGLGGLVKAEQLKLLMTRPLGLKDVTNPIEATGAADRESADEARRNGPLTVLTLDRIVSLRDYEDFCRAYAGIAKALATWTWDGERRGVFVTLAGPKGAKIRSDSDTYKNLLSAMQKAGDPRVSIRVDSYRPAFFKISAKVKTDPDRETEKVLKAIEKPLRSHFSFDRRDFGQGVTLSEVIAVIQSVAGMVAVDVDALYRTDGLGGDGLKQPLSAAVPQPGAEGTVSAAELLLLDPGPFSNLGVML